MLSDFKGADKVYIACGYTDLRKGIDGLALLVRHEFDLDPFTNTLFLFLWYNLYLYMNREVVSETSNAEMVSIPRAEYGELLELREQNRWLMEQLRVIKSK